MERHELIQTLLADYVLGELAPADRRRVDEHLVVCQACATEVRELRLAFQGIGLAEEPVAPPAHLRERVLRGLAPEGRRPGTSRMAIPQGVLRSGSSRTWLALAATAVLVLGVLTLVTIQRNLRLQEALRQADAVYTGIEKRLANNEVQADLAVSILTAPDMRRIDLAGFDASRDAVARAYWSPGKGLLIVADRLPEPPPGRIYQVWLIGSRSAGPVSAGLLDDPRSGRGMLIVPAPPGVAGETVTIAVTDEPPGGLPAPTGGKHLVGS